MTTLFPQPRNRRRDYTSTNEPTRNPMFRERKPRRWGSAIILALALIGVAAFLILNPRFRITTVRVEGAKKLDAASIEQFVSSRLDRTFLGLAWRRVRFITPVDSLTKDLRSSIERLVSLNELSIRETVPKTLTVRISERTPNLLWMTPSGRLFLLDDHGVVIEELSGTPSPEFAVLKDSNGIEPVIGSVLALPRTVSIIEDLQSRLPSLGVTVKEFLTWPVTCNTVPNSPQKQYPEGNSNSSNVNETLVNAESLNLNVPIDASCNYRDLAVNEPTIDVVTKEGWDLRIDTSSSLDPQLEKLSVALHGQLSGDRTHLNYVDVRFGDRIFYQ